MKTIQIFCPVGHCVTPSESKESFFIRISLKFVLKYPALVCYVIVTDLSKEVRHLCASQFVQLDPSSESDSKVDKKQEESFFVRMDGYQGAFYRGACAEKQQGKSNSFFFHDLDTEAFVHFPFHPPKSPRGRSTIWFVLSF